MPKPALDTVTVQPPPRPKPRPKLPATRTVVTRAGNANKNPMDLELPTSEEEAPPKVPRKRKKKAVKTQEEVDADKQRRDAAIAAVCHLEDNMERQAKIHDGTPRRSSAANSISRRGSYVAPDPAPAPAHTQPKSRPTVVLSTTEDDYEEVRPPAKKPKSAPRAKDDIQEGQPQVKRSKTAAQVAKDKANNDFDAQMDIDSLEEEEAAPLVKKQKKSAAAKGKGKQTVAKERVTKSTQDSDFDMDIDSDDAAPAQKKKKARPVREEIDDTKLNQKTRLASDDGPVPRKPTIQPYKASQGLTPAQAQKKRVPIEDLFRGNATVVKTKKIVVQQALDTDSEVEIVEVNFNSKPSVALKGKSQPKLKVKAVKPDRDSYRQADSEEEQSALINDWSSRVVGQPNRKRAGGASKASTPTLTSGTSKPSRASKASSSSRTALNNKVKIRNSDKYDNVVDDNGGFVSEDERYSGERVLAANSPLKGKGNRVTSSSLVKIKESRSRQHLAVPSTLSNTKKPTSRSAITVVTVKSEELDVKPASIVSEKKTSKKVTNADLPPKYLDNGAWRMVIAALIRYIATTYEVFSVKDSTMIHALTTLSTVIYGETAINLVAVTTSSVPFRLAIQRLSDGWRTIIGSAAIAALTAFFDSDPKWTSDARRKKFALRLYQKQRYLYRHAEGDDKKRFKGLFRGPFVIQTFAAHLNIISGSKEVLELYADAGITQTDQIPKARGAVALCAAAVMRAVALYATEGVTLCSLKDANGIANNRLDFPAMIPPISDTEIRDNMKRSSAFSALSWEDPTSYMAKACKGLTDDDMASIIHEAKAFSKASRRQAREIGSDLDPDNSLLQLGDESDSSGDEDMIPVRGAGYSNPADSGAEVEADLAVDEDIIEDSEAEDEDNEMEDITE